MKAARRLVDRTFRPPRLRVASGSAASRSPRRRSAGWHLVVVRTPEVSGCRPEVLAIVRPAPHRAVVAVLDLVIRPVPLVGPAVAGALAGDTQINQRLRKNPPEACSPTKRAVTGARHHEKLRRLRLNTADLNQDAIRFCRESLAAPACHGAASDCSP
jgi:hypothetical protein